MSAHVWSKKAFFIENNLAPKIIGIDRRKENLVANSLVSPQNIPATIVEPEREIPSRIAKD